MYSGRDLRRKETKEHEVQFEEEINHNLTGSV